MAKKTVSEILQRAECEIAEIATEAAKDRDYDRAERLLAVARQLAMTAARLDQPLSQPSSAANASIVGIPPKPANDEEGEEDAPVFERDGDELVKTGKSGEGKVYEHKAPRQTVDSLLRAIADRSTKRGEFRTSRIFPLLDTEGRKLPGYQGYLCLRWLRQIGLVHRLGRQRYQLVEGLDPSATVESAWQSLHEREA